MNHMGIKEDIDLLNNKLNQLRIDYEQYFAGTIKVEPYSLRRDIEELIKKNSNRFIENTAMRFRYNSLVAKFNSYNQYWERGAKNIEEGKSPKNNIAKLKIKKLEKTEEDNTLINEDKIKEVYFKYIEARILCNEPINNISYEKLKSIIEKETPLIVKKYNCKDISLKVKIENNRAKIKIIPQI